MAIRDRFGFNWLTIGLLAIVSAEVLVLVTGKTGIGNLLTPIWSMGAGMYGYVGPVLFPMVLFATLLVYVAYKLIQTYRGTHVVGSPAGFYRALKVIEVIAPAFGFLGTTLALVKVMANIDPGLSQSGMLKALLNNSASAFGSTVLGLVLSIAAYLTREVFENFLLARYRSRVYIEPVKEVNEDRKEEACT